MIGYILTIIAIVVGAFYFLYPRYEQLHLHRPKLLVDLAPGKGFTKSCWVEGLSAKNPPTIIAGSQDTWYIYKLSWEFDLVVRNNSEFNAYEVKLLQHKNKPQIKFRNKINFNKALGSQEEIVLPFTIHKYVECQVKDRGNHYKDKPDLLKDLMIVFDYKNPKGKTFQSRYFFNTDKTDYRKIPKAELKEYWR